MLNLKIVAKLYNKFPKNIKKKAFQLYKYLPSRKKTIIKQVDGITYVLDLSKRIPASIYYYGCFEEDTTRIINNYVKEGMVVFDIGANMGCHALRCAKLVGNKGKVYAFEPMTSVLTTLRYEIALNNFENIVAEKLALSNINEKKDIAFHIYSTLTNEKLRPEEESVTFIKMDNYIKDNNIERLDFMKIDVDGYETKVLAGGKNSLKKFKPMIIIEMGRGIQKRYGDSMEKLINLLSTMGYSFYNEKTMEKYPTDLALLLDVPKRSTINVFCRVEK